MRKPASGLLAFLSAVLCGAATAAIVPAPGAPLQVRAARGGAEVVDIAMPNAAGVSVNAYRRFDVDARGAVLMNSARSVNSAVTGDALAGHARADFTSAALILNEVVGADPTRLRGALEIAGPRADLVIANPNGMTCEGCGFINAGRVALATGRAVLDAGGGLHALGIDGGALRIDAPGLVADAAALARLDLLARSIVVDARVDVPDLRAVAGVNQVRWDDLAPAPRSADRAPPLFAIQFGHGLRAGAITLVATEDGAGVNGRGSMTADRGDLHIASGGDIDIGAGGALVSSGGHMVLEARGEVAVRAPIASGAACDMFAQGDVTVAADARAGAGLGLHGNALTLRGSDLHAGADTHLSARGGMLDARDCHLCSRGRVEARAAQALLATGANWRGRGDIDLAGSRVAVDGHAMIDAGAGLRIDANVADIARGALRAKSLEIQAGTLLAGHGVVDVQGPLDAKVTALLDASGGYIQSGDALHLSTSTLRNRQGVVQSRGDATIASGRDCKNTRGTMRAEGALTLHVGGTLKNRTGTIHGGDAMALEVNGRLNNAGGRVLGFGPSLRVEANQGVDNSHGLMAARSGTLEVTAGPQAPVEAGGSAWHGVADNTLGVLMSGEDCRWTGGELRNEKGVLFAFGALEFDGQRVSNEHGLISSTYGQDWRLRGDVENTGGWIESVEGDIRFAIGQGSIRNAAGTLRTPHGRVHWAPAHLLGALPVMP